MTRVPQSAYWCDSRRPRREASTAKALSTATDAPSAARGVVQRGGASFALGIGVAEGGEGWSGLAEDGEG